MKSESSERCFEDIEGLSNAFVEQGWPERKDILHKYFLEQEEENAKFWWLLLADFWQVI